MGNPALWWGSLMMISVALAAFRQRNRIALFIVVPFLAQWVLFFPITRVLFIYHFYPNVLFVILAVVFLLEPVWAREKWRGLGYLAANAAAFVFFLPIISGLFMPQGYWNALYLVLTWAGPYAVN
jgi:dolichyl-phosphate-mannose--protein O-mannosyl transferase